ncbi:hypothetical protein GJ496_005179 [Pomphorhynchus laevis]|nr:hypothetical protein GJ496_005179 [Pomphorhynchus laevis]
MGDAKSSMRANLLLTYVDFYPSFEDPSSDADDIIKYDTFLKAIDVYYSHAEKQKEEINIFHKEKSAISKLLNVEKDLDARSKQLQSKQAEYLVKATILQNNIDNVDRALLIIRNALDNDLSWEDIEEMVSEAKKKNNPVAMIVDRLKLLENTAVIKLW